MSDLHESTTRSPQLPVLLTLPFRVIPQKIHSSVLVAALNRFLADDLHNGELDFLQGRIVAIKVNDAAISWQLSMSGNMLVVVSKKQLCDLSIQASIYDFIKLASRQVDPDTLVFQRRLIVEGDTDLGLSLKNYLDALDVESSRVLRLMESMSHRALPIYARLFG